jgi:hypothetical protein
MRSGHWHMDRRSTFGVSGIWRVARVAHRTLDQPQILVNNLAIRRAIEELKVARDYEQVHRILQAAFGNNDFDGFDLRIEPPATPLAFIPPLDSAARRSGSFHWSKPGVMKPWDGCAVWTVVLDLLSSSNHRRGTQLMHRLYSQRDLQLDIHLLTAAFPIALADALGAHRRAPGRGHSIARSRYLADCRTGGLEPENSILLNQFHWIRPRATILQTGTLYLGRKPGKAQPAKADLGGGEAFQLTTWRWRTS